MTNVEKFKQIASEFGELYAKKIKRMATALVAPTKSWVSSPQLPESATNITGYAISPPTRISITLASL